MARLVQITDYKYIMVIYRRYPATPAAGPAAFSSLLLLPVAMYYSEPFAIPFHDFMIMAAFGLIFAIASATLAEGMKRIPAGEAALLSALETPLAPLFAWIFFAEMPAHATSFCSALAATVKVPLYEETKLWENASRKINDQLVGNQHDN